MTLTAPVRAPGRSAGAPPELTGRSDAVGLLTVYLVLLLAVPAPMVVSALGQVGGPSTLLAIGCFLLWGWVTVNRTTRSLASRNPVRTAALLLLLVVLAVYANSAMLPLPVDERSPADSVLLRFVGFVGLVALTSSGISSRRRLWVFVERLSLGAGAITVVAILQIVTGQAWVDRLSLPGLTASAAVELQARGVILRPAGTSTHPIEFAAVLAMLFPWVLVAALHSRRRPVLLKVVLVLVAGVLLLTGSRTAIVCGGVAFVTMLPALQPRTRVWACVGGAGMVAAMFVALPGFVGTIVGLFKGASGDSSIASRTNSYAVVGEFFGHHPWMGRGLGTFLPRYWIFDNQYLQLLVGGGLLAVAAMAGLIATAIWSARRARTLSVRPDDRLLAYAARASVLSGAVSLALFDAFSFAQAAGTFFLAVGLSGAVYRLALLDRLRSSRDAGPTS